MPVVARAPAVRPGDHRPRAYADPARPRGDPTADGDAALPPGLPRTARSGSRSTRSRADAKLAAYSAVVKTFRFGQLGLERPGEARPALARREAAGPRAAVHEQHRQPSSADERRPELAEPLGPPAGREAGDDDGRRVDGGERARPPSARRAAARPRHRRRAGSRATRRRAAGSRRAGLASDRRSCRRGGAAPVARRRARRPARAPPSRCRRRRTGRTRHRPVPRVDRRPAVSTATSAGERSAIAARSPATSPPQSSERRARRRSSSRAGRRRAPARAT